MFDIPGKCGEDVYDSRSFVIDINRGICFLCLGAYRKPGNYPQ